MTLQRQKACEFRIALNEVVLQIPWLTKSTFGQLLGAEANPREIDRLIRRLCKNRIIECRIQNAVILGQLLPLSRPEQVSDEFLSQVKKRSEIQSFRAAKPAVFVRASRLTAGLTGRDYSRALSFDELNATIRLGDAIQWNSSENVRTSTWELHRKRPENKLPAMVASFVVPKSLKKRYCVVPLPLSFRTTEKLIRNLHYSEIDYEIW